MRRIFTKGHWLLDVALFDRDSFYLHIFFLSLVKAGNHSWQIKTPDLRIRMWTKALPIPKRADDWLKGITKDINESDQIQHP